MIKYAILTEFGDRKINEDTVGAFKKQNNYCFIVCDGLGGHGMGDVASSCVCDTFKTCFNNSDDIPNLLPSAFDAAQNNLMQEQIYRKAQKKMKTTAVAIAFDNYAAYVGHVGDSRAYYFYKNKVKCRTIDHSIPQMMVLSRQIKEKDIRHHPDRNIVLRVMGVKWEEPMYDLLNPIPLKKEQSFLLCSDGFWELIEEKDMCKLLKAANSPEEWLTNMKTIVCENGKSTEMDNYSAIAIWSEV